MKIKDWTVIEPAKQGGSMLPPGGYVVRITDVEDVPSREYLRFTYDIAEGEHAGHYSDDFGKNNPYTHQFVRSYTDRASAFFSQFLEALELSNRGRFSVAEWSKRCDEREMIGLEIGVVLQLEQFTNGKGEDKRRLNGAAFYAAQDIRNGDYKALPDLDNRKGSGDVAKADADTADLYAGDIPFL